MDTKIDLEELELQQYWLVLKRRWPIAAAVLVASVGLAGFFALRQKPQYEASGLLLFKSDRISSLTKVGEKIGDLESLRREGNPLQTQAVIVSSEPILQETISVLNLKDKKGKPLEPDALKLQVEALVGTDVLKISHRADSPETSAAVVNQVMRTFIDTNIRSNRTQVFAAGEFIRNRLPIAERELRMATEALRQFKVKNNTVQLKEEATAAIANLSTLEQQINQAQTSLVDIAAQEKEIQEQLNLSGQKAVEVASLSQIPGVQEVLTEQQKVQSKLVTLQGRYTNSHPTIIDLKSQDAALQALLARRVVGTVGSTENLTKSDLQIGKLKQDLAAKYVELTAQRQGLEQKLQGLLTIRANYQSRLNILPNLDKSQGDLERRLTVAQKDYENLVTRLQEIEVAEKQTIGNARVVQPAKIPQKPALSKLTLLLLGGGIFVGSLVGISAAFFVDLVDRSLKTVKETEKFFGYTMLGLIPKFDTHHPDRFVKKMMGETVSERVIVASSPRTIIHEAYQMLQANLKFIRHEQVCTIVVTSSVSGEGKSEVAANLAAIIAQTGRRVLLVDADMRQPSQHHLWGLINGSGLSNVIVGQDDFSASVNNITDNLSVLTAGVQPPNPLALIDSEGMAALIRNASDSYDYVVFDTPPLAGTADTAVLGKMVDGVLLVARPKVLDLASAQAAKSLLERSDAKILGIIANAVNIKQESEGYFYYSDPRLKANLLEAEASKNQNLLEAGSRKNG